MAEHSIGGFKEVIKCVVVGDSGVGKTCLICSFACGTTYDLRKLVKTHQATVFAIDTYQHEPEILDRSWCDVDGCQVSLRLWDTFGHHDKDRGFAYKGVMRPNTLRNVLKVWNVEIQHSAPNVPVILCGTQADLRYLCYDDHYLTIEKGLLYRDISSSDIITPSDGREVARDIGAPYYETSVLTQYGVTDVFVNAARAALIERMRLKFLSIELRRIQKPLVQPPMKMPTPSFQLLEIAQPNRESCHSISSLIHNKSECDVTFLIENQCIAAHRICLALASDFFKDLFSLESLAKFQTKKKTNAQLRKQFPHRFSHTDSEYLLDSDQDSLSTDTDCGSNSKELTGESFLSVQSNRPFSQFPLSIPYDHEAVDYIEIRCLEGECPVLSTFIALNPEITADAFHVILDYLYSGKFNPKIVELAHLRKSAELLQLMDLTVIIDNLILGHGFVVGEMEKQFHLNRTERLRDLIFGLDFLTDVTFEVEKGLVSAHKALLMVGCEMMYAMFSNDFIESASDIIPFPGITEETFKALQDYLYTGLSPSLNGVEIISLIELANRLCLPHLLHLVEVDVIAELLICENKEEMLRDVITLLEPAELYNAQQLFRFCKYTLSINFLEAGQTEPKLLKTLTPATLDEIEMKQWPPVWYLKEVDFYEKQVKNSPLSTTQSVAQEYRPKASCLCFCSRRRRRKHLLPDPVDLPP